MSETRPAGATSASATSATGNVIDVEEVHAGYVPEVNILNGCNLYVGPGEFVGIIGPNGAGKSTLLQLATGQLRPSQGTVHVLGQPVWNNAALNRSIGLCPEQDAFYEWMTGSDFVYTCARLGGMRRAAARAAAERTIESVGMTAHRDRTIRGYSKGMRQRIKLAQALVHDPQVVFLDEPLTGTDPVARRDLMDIILQMGREGKCVLVSSHVLYEVQALTPNIVLLHRGRLVAVGHVREIRDLIDKHPHHIRLVCDDYRRLATRLMACDDVEGIRVLPGENGVVVETRMPDVFYSRLPALSLEDGLAIKSVYSADDNLEAVFKYLVDQ
jgi:ABC-2 type transport system ATP-binding protein